MISSPLWRRLGSDRTIIGKPLVLDGRSHTVTGVLPEYFQFPVDGILSAGERADVWIPLDPTGRGEPATGAIYFAYARRRADVTFAVAEADVKRVAAEIAAEAPTNHPEYTARVFDLRTTVIKDVRLTLLVLLAAAAFLFLVACASAAGLLLARSIARARETAMRLALGASPSRLARHYLAESLPIALVGALAGIGMSLALTTVAVSMVGSYLPRADEITVDLAVVAFAAGSAILASSLSSLAPLWHALRAAPAGTLGSGSRTSAGARAHRASRALVVGEIALACTLLVIGATLFSHVRGLARTPTGLAPDDVLTFMVPPGAPAIPGRSDDGGATPVPLQRRLVDALKSIPGVDAAAVANQLPLDGCCLGANIYPEERRADPVAGQRTSIMAVSPDYFRVMGIPLRRGRLLDEVDLRNDPAVAVISQSAVTRYWGDRDPLGTYGRFGNPDGARFQVIGVVGDVRNDGLGNPPVPDIYVLSGLRRLATMNVVIRSARPVAALLPEIRRAVRSVDPELPIHQVAAMRDIIQRSMTLERAASVLTTFFALAALLLAALGVYGILSYFVRQRRVEIGTRIALGATGRRVLALFLGDGLFLAAIGIVAGGFVGFGASLYLANAFGIANVGPIPMAQATAAVIGAALGASAVPAWRASRLSPMAAIRD